MLTEVFKNRKLIWEGLRNRIFKSDHVEAVFLERIKICDSCPHKDIEGKKCALAGTQPCCSLCGCSLSLKLRSLASECPDKRWQALVNEQEEEMIRQQILNNKLNGTENAG